MFCLLLSVVRIDCIMGFNGLVAIPQFSARNINKAVSKMLTCLSDSFWSVVHWNVRSETTTNLCGALFKSLLKQLTARYALNDQQFQNSQRVGGKNMRKAKEKSKCRKQTLKITCWMSFCLVPREHTQKYTWSSKKSILCRTSGIVQNLLRDDTRDRSPEEHLHRNTFPRTLSSEGD